MNKLNLFRYVKRYSFLYLIAIVAMTAGTLLDQAAPLIVQHIIDDVLIAKKMNKKLQKLNENEIHQSLS